MAFYRTKEASGLGNWQENVKIVDNERIRIITAIQKLQGEEAENNIGSKTLNTAQQHTNPYWFVPCLSGLRLGVLLIVLPFLSFTLLLNFMFDSL